MTIRDTPKKYANLYKRAMSGRSRKAAMRMFCLECAGYSETNVCLCTDLNCPLSPYRPKLKPQVPPDAIGEATKMATSSSL